MVNFLEMNVCGTLFNEFFRYCTGGSNCGMQWIIRPGRRALESWFSCAIARGSAGAACWTRPAWPGYRRSSECDLESELAKSARPAWNNGDERRLAGRFSGSRATRPESFASNLDGQRPPTRLHSAREVIVTFSDVIPRPWRRLSIQDLIIPLVTKNKSWMYLRSKRLIGFY